MDGRALCLSVPPGVESREHPAIGRLASLCRIAAATFRVPVVRLLFDDPTLGPLEVRDGSDHPETQAERDVCAWLRRCGATTGEGGHLPDFVPEHGTAGLRLIANVPIVAASHARIGILCLFDVACRRLAVDEEQRLADFAGLVSEWPDLRRCPSDEARTPYGRIVEMIRDAFIETDAEGALVARNGTAEMHGRPLAETTIPNPPRACHARDTARRPESGSGLVAGRPRLEREALHMKEPTSPVEVAPSRPDGSDRMAISALLNDISRLKERERQIAHMARHDALTGLINRDGFHACLTERLDRLEHDGVPFALLYLDLDRLAVINETLGHRAGDAVLVEVAARLRRALRQKDVVARIGGDEFAILQIEAARQPASAAALAQRLIEAVTGPAWIQGKLVEIGLSIGIVVAPTDGRDSQIILKRADLALSRAKADGRNTRRFYETVMDSAAEARRNLEIDLRGALSRGEFEVCYQPIVDAQTGRPSGAEALVRWHHPRNGLVSPTAFIALAEETGLIVALGEWVMRTACLEAAGWPSDMRIAVNISAVQFRQARFVEVVLHALAETGLAPERLELEITETVLMQSLPQVVDALHMLRRLGVRISLDDFGTGYSSLSYLRTFPFDKLKIDQSFVQDLANPATASIVQAVVTLGRGLGMTVTAEGVETEEQRAAVRDYGCSDLQGYLFGRPRASADFVREHLSGRTRRAA